MSLMIKKLRLGSISEPCSGLAPQTPVHAGKFLLWQHQLDENWTYGNTTRTTCQRKPWLTRALPSLPHIDPVSVQHPWEKGSLKHSTREETSFKNRTRTIKGSNKILTRLQLFLLFCTQLPHRVLITALQPAVKCQENISCYSNQYLQCNPDMEQVTASFPLPVVRLHPYNCSVHPTDSYKFLENNCKKTELAVRGGNQPDRGVVLCCTGYCFQYQIRIYCFQTKKHQKSTAISISHPPHSKCFATWEGKVPPAPGAAQLCLWLSQSCLIWNFSSSHRNSGDPPTPPAGGAAKERAGQRAHACVTCSGRGRGKQNDFIHLWRGVKTRRLLFQAVHGLKYRRRTEH